MKARRPVPDAYSIMGSIRGDNLQSRPLYRSLPIARLTPWPLAPKALIARITEAGEPRTRRPAGDEGVGPLLPVQV